MTIQDLGSIGELVAAIATVATLVYLATQVRQNTRALRSSTFQNISEQMAQNAGVVVVQPELSSLLLKGAGGLDALSPPERLQFNAFMIMSFRRMESVHVQAEIGSITEDLKRGFEISLLGMLHTAAGAEWWASAKVTFHHSFTAYVDSWLAANPRWERHPSLGVIETA